MPVENLSKPFGEFKYNYQSVCCNKLLVLSYKNKDVATNMLKQTTLCHLAHVTVERRRLFTEA